MKTLKATIGEQKKIPDVENSLDLINIFQTFYQITGRLPLSNGLLVVPDGDPPPGEDRVNMKSLYDMFRHTISHGLVSLPFLGLLQYCFKKHDFALIKKSLTELFQNLSYIVLNGARDFDFTAISDLTAKVSFLLKAASSNIAEMEKADIQNAYNINKSVSFVPKQEGPLDVVIDILNENAKHKKMTHPYVPPQVQTAAEIETETRQIDDKFAKLNAEYDRVNDAAVEQKKQDDIADLVDGIINKSNPFQNLNTEDIWIEDDIFDYKDHPDIIDTSKDILKAIRENDPFLDLNIPTDAIIDDLFEPSDDKDNDVTTEDLFDPSDEEPEFIIAEPGVPEDEIIIPDTNSVSIDTGPKQSKKYITTRMKGGVRAAKKVKEKYKKQQRKK